MPDFGNINPELLPYLITLAGVFLFLMGYWIGKGGDFLPKPRKEDQ